MTVEHSRDEQDDQFPVGMRVLAVDDDPICLRLLDTLLRKCQYHVTTTNQAVTALKMLRANKNKFDLVISDVHMPDMDGFKLLELVGLEMDLPVIMLSANGDTKLVMKGISHGACDYLLKPVRLEELKNIWQHVIRRRKFDSRDQNNSNGHDRNASDGNGSRGANSDQDAKLSRKRKDQNADDDEDQDENEHENEDPSSQKKPRVVWSVDLHRKFVAAVNQLGLDKAVPKKILELMNVDKLTRENVASHLQKYRLYLKRISSVANQQANMVAALGGPDYLRMSSMNFHGFNATSHFPNSLRSIPPPGVLGRLNTPAGLGLHGIPPPGLVPLGPAQSQMSTSSTILQGMPTSLEFDEVQKGNDVLNGSSNSILNLPNSSLTMQGRSSQELQAFGVTSGSPPNLLDHNRCNNSWPAAVQSQPTHMNSLETISIQNHPNVMTENMIQNVGYPTRPVWDPDYLETAVNSSIGSSQSEYGSVTSVNPSEVLHRNTGFTSMSQPGFDSLGMQYDHMGLKMKQGLFGELGGRVLGSYNASNGAGCLEDVVTAIFKHV